MHRFSDFRVADVPLACWLAAGTLALASMPAHAVFTVIEDDLLPEAMIAARNAPSVPVGPDRFAVAFPKFQTALGPLGMATLDMLLPNMKGGTIRVVGRPDALPYTGNEKQAFLARYRAVNIRNYLVRKGIPESAITVEVDNSPNPQPTGSNYPCDIYVTRAEVQSPAPSNAVYTESRYTPEPTPARQAAPVYTTSRPGMPLPAALTPQPAMVQQVYQAPANSDSDQVIAYINQAVQSGKMHPTVALSLIRTLMSTESGRASPMQVAAPIAAAPQYITQPAPIPVAPAQVWMLNKDVGVRENIDAWSRTAGWKPSEWMATNNYRIGRASPDSVEGAFPEVLRMLATGSGLNICANKPRKTVRVTDANVDCEKN